MRAVFNVTSEVLLVRMVVGAGEPPFVTVVELVLAYVLVLPTDLLLDVPDRARTWFLAVSQEHLSSVQLGYSSRHMRRGGNDPSVVSGLLRFHKQALTNCRSVCIIPTSPCNVAD